MRKSVDVVVELVTRLSESGKEISQESPLIGDGGCLDSMALVELCLALEDHARELGFDFDWSSEKAMSRSQSMFRSSLALANEFDHQHRNST